MAPGTVPGTGLQAEVEGVDADALGAVAGHVDAGHPAPPASFLTHLTTGVNPWVPVKKIVSEVDSL